ncbi:inositol monophosphatase family protein [Paenibacillus sp. NPDC057934]|uniref:inositol monophosphatase family protein n=1 Tax=Paenibacillus sp. NPDC057934 TaxID=3346282 RepID=UPI0036D81178
MTNSTTVDIDFCSELIVSLGAKLREECKKDLRLTTFEEVYARAKEMSEWVTRSLKEPLATKYPSILWSDSEFNLDNQRQAESAGEYWVLDPLDGALHFVQGFSFFALSLCLVRAGQPVVSFVYDPSSRELFHAVSGQGAFMNGSPIHVAAKQELAQSYITTSLPSNPAKEPDISELTVRGITRFMSKTVAVKMLGAVSLQLAYVASGRLDGYFEFGDDYYDWLAGSLLVQEAGGTITDGQGGPFTWGTSGIITANTSLHGKMVAELREL